MRIQLQTPARRGVATVELAVCLPIFVALLFGIWEVGRLAEAQQILTNAAREGARQAAMGTQTNAQVVTVVQNYLANAGVPNAHATITVTNATHPGVDASAASQLDTLQVTVTVPVTDLRWLASSFFVPSTNVLYSQATWSSMANKAYPAPSDPPVNY